jgi:uncharacterized membrane protein YdjX (TVP38/TMEM64 family)
MVSFSGVFLVVCICVLALAPPLFLHQNDLRIRAYATEFHLAGQSVVYTILRIFSFLYIPHIHLHLLEKNGFAGAVVVVTIGEAAGNVTGYWLVKYALRSFYAPLDTLPYILKVFECVAV